VFPDALTRAESDALIEWHERSFAQHGFRFWAVETRESGAFIGFVGLAVPLFQSHRTPSVEVGWRLARAF
jgi:RimJ/RimL family protein N-acetyltransferase